MADVELVIKIPEEQYRTLNAKSQNDVVAVIDDALLIKSIKNGIPLPEHHGDLKDANSVPEEDKDIIVKSLLYPGTIAFAGAILLEEYVNNLPTIIPATKEGAE